MTTITSKVPAETAGFVSGYAFRRAKQKLGGERLQPPFYMAIPARRADPTHVKVGARTFFVTSSAWGKQNLLQSDRAAKLFLLVIYDYRAQFSKGGFSFRAGKELAIRSPVCQKGFSEVRIADSEGVLQVRTYIRNNPVVRHLVADPEDYLYSSAHPGFELDPVPQGLNVLLRSG